MSILPKLFKRDTIGTLILFKRIVFFLMGIIAFFRFKKLNKAVISGAEYIEHLPQKNVLIVSNHQTYFADVSMMLLTFFSIKNGFKNRIGPLWCLLNPNYRVYFIAASETMKKGILPRIFKYAGGILVKRTWRENGKNIQRSVDLKDTENVAHALKDGWVITFPQGTTTPFAKGRKGTAYIIKEHKPIVVPARIDGFRRAFDKKGILIKKKGVQLKLSFLPPLNINYNDKPELILNRVMESIGQSDENISPSLKEKVISKRNKK